MTAMLSRPIRRHEVSRTVREQAVAMGVDPFVAGTTSISDLRAVIAAAAQIRIVDDVDVPDAPRIGRPLTPLQRMEIEGFTPDEIASVLTFVTGKHTDSAWVSADGFTPLDHYTGGGDAA